MPTRVDVDPQMLTWAILRAGYTVDEYVNKDKNVAYWLDRSKQPTVKQLESFSERLHLPFGYLLLKAPPQENLPIPFFRTNGVIPARTDLAVYDTILDVLSRQEWLSQYRQEEQLDKVEIVGRFSEQDAPGAIVAGLRERLGLPKDWAFHEGSAESAVRRLSLSIEQLGVFLVSSGVVGNNNTRGIPVDKCRGFVLADEYAPFVFVNAKDAKPAQLFTLIHELAHLCLNSSAAFDLKYLIPSNHPIEILCDKVAAEFLVPADLFQNIWQREPAPENIARKFKVSRLVIARRALELGVWDKRAFIEYLSKIRYVEQQMAPEGASGGGNFWNTTTKRVGLGFAGYIRRALGQGKLSFREAYRLTGLSGDTFKKFFDRNF